jgi:hypothetical protein
VAGAAGFAVFVALCAAQPESTAANAAIAYAFAK